MKVTIVASLFAEWDVKINTRHNTYIKGKIRLINGQRSRANEKCDVVIHCGKKILKQL